MNFRVFLLPIFILKLVLANTYFLLNVVALPVKNKKTSLFIVFLFLLYSLFLINSFQKPPTISEDILPTFVPNSPQEKIIVYKNLAEISEIKTNLENIFLLSPTTRNISLNLALISFYQNNFQEYFKYWNLAKTNDPNNPLFLTSP